MQYGLAAPRRRPHFAAADRLVSDQTGGVALLRRPLPESSPHSTRTPMITPEDLPVVPVFASVPPEDLARLAQAAGDVRLGAGDYAVHEGDERSLFVVLAGRIEVTKVIDGIERVIGQRAPGQIFGEVPIIFGMPYQGSYRATAPSRVMQLPARQFHALAAA